ncbi:sensor histidine kinase [Lacticaseibacillus rhamnosus]|uniref:sensor histidine kinase n=1 Tax=Lacticaseibacillus rhamnosus TaxID=47715 RepID=UPI00237F431E|nr:HAMP domain-containing sensor histidine kinase [Lacticaseibacillus rhamnosus]MDE3295974.1 HAMP domain-containing histidine kinase [Lacticaseibacillus rhamnosus]
MVKHAYWTMPETRQVFQLTAILIGILWTVLLLTSITVPDMRIWLVLVGGLATGISVWLTWCWARKFSYHFDQALLQLDMTKETEDNYLIDRNDEGLFSDFNNRLYHYARQMQAEREAIKRDRDHLNEAITDIAHQLRTPLAANSNLLEMMAESNWKTTRLALQAQQQHQAQLIEQLILLAKVDTHTLSQRREIVVLTDLGKAALSPFLRQIADKEITVDWQVPPALTINVNSVLVKEAFANVFKNAVAHTPVGGRISVRGIGDPVRTRLMIMNTGQPIAAQDLPHLFERFYRGQYATANNVGIGLAIAAGITTANDGWLTAANTANGVQMTFEFFR